MHKAFNFLLKRNVICTIKINVLQNCHWKIHQNHFFTDWVNDIQQSFHYFALANGILLVQIIFIFDKNKNKGIQQQRE